jgi:cyclic lactone autoinducer peptide
MKRLVLLLAGILSVFAAATAVASATLILGYQPKMPDSLQ